MANPRTGASLAEVPLAVRGAHGLKLAVLKLGVAAERAVRAVMLIMGAVIIFAAAANRDTVIARTNALIGRRDALAQIGWDIRHSTCWNSDKHALGVVHHYLSARGFRSPHTAVLQLVGVGPLGGRRWAEYLAVVATSVFHAGFCEMAQHPRRLSRRSR